MLEAVGPDHFAACWNWREVATEVEAWPVRAADPGAAEVAVALPAGQPERVV